MTDDELQELGLISLTQEHHLTLQQELISRLKRINEQFVALHSHYLTPKCSLRRVIFRTPFVQPTDTKIDGTALFDLFIDLAHGLAAAHQHCARHSAIGAMIQRRLAVDLKNTKHRLLLGLVNDLCKSSKYADASSSKILQNASIFGAEKTAAVLALECQFSFGKYCSIFQDEGVDLRDMDLLAREFALHISAADARVLAAQLDPEGSSFIYFLYFLRWIRSEQPHLYLRESLRARQSVLRALQSVTRLKYFFHAADVMLARYRSILRMEVTVREGILYSDAFSGDMYTSTLRAFYLRCEGGTVQDDLNARKYHIMPQSQKTRAAADVVMDDASSLASLGHNSLLEGAVPMGFRPETSGLPMEDSNRVPIFGPKNSAESAAFSNRAPTLLHRVSESPTDHSLMLSPSGRANSGVVFELRNSAESATSIKTPVKNSADGRTSISVTPTQTPVISAKNSADSPAPKTPLLFASNSAESDNAGGDVTAEGVVEALPDKEKSFEEDENEDEEEGESTSPSHKSFVKPVIRGGLYENLTKWYTLKWREEESENRVVYQVVERRAAVQYWRSLLTLRGQYNLWTERQLLVMLDATIDAVGHCLPSKKAHVESDLDLVTIQQALSFMQGTSVSSMASSSLQNYSATLHNTVSFKDGPFQQIRPHVYQTPFLADNASISSHTHSLVLDNEEHPFAYLDPESIHGHSTLGSVHEPVNPGSPGGGENGGNATIGMRDGDDDETINHEVVQPVRITAAKNPKWEASVLTVHGAALHAIALEMVVSVFDTDCTADLDEIEVRMLLRCLRCGMSEKAFRHVFADNDDIIRGVTVRRLLNHLRERVRWNRDDLMSVVTGHSARELSITKVANIHCAAGILVSLQRQLAHKRALQTVRLSKIGKISVLRQSHAGSSDQTLLVRSQLFAMRQVHMFLRTTQGRIKFQHVLLDVKFSWQRDVISPLSNVYISSSGATFLNYAFSIHLEADGVLVTELPHVVKFLIKRCKLVPTRRIEELSQLFCELRGVEDIRTLSQAEFSSLLAPLFHKPDKAYANSFWSRVGLNRQLHRDAKLRMLSCARQQAVMIAMEFPVVEVSETNYRCSVLGMHRFINENISWSLKPPKGNVRNFFKFRTNANKQESAPPAATLVVDAAEVGSSAPSLSASPLASIATDATTKSNVESQCVPKEAVALHLLSLGYTVRDLSHSGLAEFVDVDHLEGHIPLDLVDLDLATNAARDEIAKSDTYLKSFQRFQRSAKVYHKYHTELKRVTRALVKYPAVVDKKGAQFLKEILTGVSHCLE